MPTVSPLARPARQFSLLRSFCRNFLLALVMFMAQLLMTPSQPEYDEISYSQFLEMVRDEKVAQLMVS